MLGELDNSSSERAAAIARSIDHAGLPAIQFSDILSREWSKFVVWAGWARRCSPTLGIVRDSAPKSCAYIRSPKLTQRRQIHLSPAVGRGPWSAGRRPTGETALSYVHRSRARSDPRWSPAYRSTSM